MFDTQNNVASFVLRFTEQAWRDEQGEPQVQWRGHIQHVQGHSEDRFTDFAEAVAFIQQRLTELALNSLAGDHTVRQAEQQADVLTQSFKMWEQFAAGYTDMMFEAIEQTIRQSHALQEQLDQATECALKVWQLPGGSHQAPSQQQPEQQPPHQSVQQQPDQQQILESLQHLQAQMQALTGQVERLERALSALKDRPAPVQPAPDRNSLDQDSLTSASLKQVPDRRKSAKSQAIESSR